jgi:nucleoside diphosphate kinase
MSEGKKQKMSSGRVFAFLKPGFCNDEVKKGVMNLILAKDSETNIIFCQEIEKFPLDFVENFYKNHSKEDFFKPNNEYIISGKVFVMILQTSLDPRGLLKLKGIIRSLYGKTKRENAIHISDSFQEGEREIELFDKMQNEVIISLKDDRDKLLAALNEINPDLFAFCSICERLFKLENRKCFDCGKVYCGKCSRTKTIECQNCFEFVCFDSKCNCDCN